MAKSKINQDLLIDTAWEYLDEALKKGTVTLPGRANPLVLDADHVVRICQWLAQRTAKKPRHTTTVEDFLGGGDAE